MPDSQETGRQGKRDGFGSRGSESLWNEASGLYLQGEDGATHIWLWPRALRGHTEGLGARGRRCEKPLFSWLRVTQSKGRWTSIVICHLTITASPRWHPNRFSFVKNS